MSESLYYPTWPQIGVATFANGKCVAATKYGYLSYNSGPQKDRDTAIAIVRSTIRRLMTEEERNTIVRQDVVYA